MVMLSKLVEGKTKFIVLKNWVKKLRRCPKGALISLRRGEGAISLRGPEGPSRYDQSAPYRAALSPLPNPGISISRVRHFLPRSFQLKMTAICLCQPFST